jgi:hypothetical protein
LSRVAVGAPEIELLVKIEVAYYRAKIYYSALVIDAE